MGKNSNSRFGFDIFKIYFQITFSHTPTCCSIYLMLYVANNNNKNYGGCWNHKPKYLPRVLVWHYLLDIWVWHLVTRKHLVGLAGERGEREGFLLGQSVAQHGQLCAETKHQSKVANSLSPWLLYFVVVSWETAVQSQHLPFRPNTAAARCHCICCLKLKFNSLCSNFPPHLLALSGWCRDGLILSTFNWANTNQILPLHKLFKSI